MLLSLASPAESNATIAQASGKVTIKCSFPSKTVHPRLRTYVHAKAVARHLPNLKQQVCYERVLLETFITGKTPYITNELITIMFGPRASSARRVGRCESTYQVAGPTRGINAKNGKYVGVYQIEPAKRKKYGWYERGWPAYYHVTSAYRMSSGGRYWGAWSCKP